MKVTAKSAIGSMSHSFMNNSNKSKITTNKTNPNLIGMSFHSTFTFILKHNIRYSSGYSQIAFFGSKYVSFLRNNKSRYPSACSSIGFIKGDRK